MDDKSVPGFTATPELEAKLEGLDDNLLPVDKVSEEPKKDEPAEPKEEPKETPADKEPEEEAEPEKDGDEPENTESDKEVPDENEGYAIDESDEPAEEKDDKVENAPDRSQLNAEQQFILDGIQPITVRGTVGDDKVQEYKVYSPEQLPDGFRYVDDKTSATAAKAFAMLESKAVELQNEFRTQETKKSADAFKKAEDAADRAEIGTLQRNGDLPKFKLEPDDPKFATDPAAVQIQEVLDFKDKKNAEYLEAANAGRPYKHIGFEEAFLMFKREAPVDTAQAKEDADRKGIAKRTTGTTGAKTETTKARVHSGMGSMDLDNLIEERTQGW